MAPSYHGLKGRSTRSAAPSGRYPRIMFRRGGKPAQSAADAERQALFEKLAQRPESVCPFLGWLPPARSSSRRQLTTTAAMRSASRNRCLRAAAQRLPAVGLRQLPAVPGRVLVIPTDELEALRRPPQKVPPPPPPHGRPPPVRSKAAGEWSRPSSSSSSSSAAVSEHGGCWQDLARWRSAITNPRVVDGSAPRP